MQRYESTLAEHGRVLSDDPSAGDSWGYHFERTYQGVYSDRLRLTAVILAFFAMLFALGMLADLFDGRWLLALCWTVLTLFFSLLLWPMVLILRRRLRAKRRGIRLLDPVPPAMSN